MWAWSENIYVPCDCSPNEFTAEGVLDHQVVTMTCFVNVSQPLSADSSCFSLRPYTQKLYRGPTAWTSSH